MNANADLMPRLARTLVSLSAIALVAATVGCAPARAQTAGPAPATVPNTDASSGSTSNPVSTPRPGSLTVSQEADPPTLEVSGTGEVSVPSDRARVSFAVETEGTTAGQAAQANADAMDAAIAALRATRAEGIVVETHGYGLHPQYSNRTEPNQAPRIVGYRAVNTITVTTTDVDAVGGLIDAATGAGVNRVASLQFDASDTEAARQEALAEAVRRARGEAEAIAGALGVPLGKVLRVHGGAHNPPRPPVPYAARGVMMEAAATPTEAGAQTVTATVTITFALGS